MITVFTWQLTVCSLIGVIANIYKRRWCFYIWAYTNLAWAIIDFHYEIYAQAALQATYFILAVWGLLKWK